MPKNLLFPLPEDLDFSKSDAVAIVNERLRRIGSSVASVARQVVDIGGGSGGPSPASEGDYIIPVVGAAAVVNVANGVNQEVPLAIPTTAIGAPGGGVLGSRLTLFLVQDATGGRLVTWDSVYKGIGLFEIDTTPLTYSVFEFVLRTGYTWWLKNTPLTGVIP